MNPPDQKLFDAGMKTRTYKQVEAAKRRAEQAAANLIGDDSRASEFADMSVEDYAELRGISIQNPKMGGRRMPSRIQQLESELEEAQNRIEELEAERADVLNALSIELVEDDDEEGEAEEEEE